MFSILFTFIFLFKVKKLFSDKLSLNLSFYFFIFHPIVVIIFVPPARNKMVIKFYVAFSFKSDIVIKRRGNNILNDLWVFVRKIIIVYMKFVTELSEDYEKHYNKRD